MPLPKPKANEKQKAFIDRCMANPTMNSEYPDRDQRYAVCMSQWKNKGKKMDGADGEICEGLRTFCVLGEGATLPRDASGAAVVPDIAISSETDAVERWFGLEILVHEPRSVDLKRIKTVGAWLINHDPNQIAGAIVKPRVEEDNVLRAGICFDATDIGQRAATQVESGSLRGASINFQYRMKDTQTIGEGETTEWRGRKITGPARIVNKWQPIEFTLTPIPADATVGVGRMAEKTKGKTNMKAKYEVVSVDGLRTWRGDNDGNPFVTRKAAAAFADCQETECEVRKIEPAESIEQPAVEIDGGDREALIRDLGAEHTARITTILDAADMANQAEYARTLLAQNPMIEQGEACRAIHAKWKEQQREANPSRPRPEPPVQTRRFQDLDDDTIAQNITRRSFNDAVLAPGHLRVDDWRAVVSNAGHHLQQRVNDMFDSGKLSPDAVSFKALYEGLRGLDTRIPCMVRDDIIGDVRAVQSTAFPIIAGSTVIAAVRKGYTNIATVADKLVDPYDSSAAKDTIPAVLTDQSMVAVAEGQPYLESGATEEYVTIGSRKQGRILSLTREMIARDQTSVFLKAANRLGEKAQTAIERLVIQRVCDSENASGFYVYQPSGTGTALYSTTARDRGTNQVASNALVDYTDLDNARALLAAMTDNEGDRINVRPTLLLVPDALVGVASRILGSEMVPGTENEQNSWGPRGMWRPELVSTPYLDDESTSDWFLGEPKKQFWQKKAFGIETTMQGRDSESWFSNDIAMRFRVAFDVEVGAVDYVYFVKSAA